ncbi:hypothetical protein [Flavobacterium stagni]|uniref:Uncharacterized protein n=1 Tax=Flavobacterium stagni TaxID=2506421 RepID=A0A4Q1K8I0_9FLAO|nr:hypothetical protein [Flavobacterium stagni]RXR22619.1 hypothetical protein EQG61_08540 [Flavobacterium stagni]
MLHHDSRIKFILFVLVLVAGLLAYLTKIMTKRFLYNYLNAVPSKGLTAVLLVLHWGTAVGVALLLPEYLKRFPNIKALFDYCPVWEYGATLCLFLLSLMGFSGILNVVFYRKNNLS